MLRLHPLVRLQVLQQPRLVGRLEIALGALKPLVLEIINQKMNHETSITSRIMSIFVFVSGQKNTKQRCFPNLLVHPPYVHVEIPP